MGCSSRLRKTCFRLLRSSQTDRSQTMVTHRAGCSKRPTFSPAQPRRAETRLSTGTAAASEEGDEVHTTLRVTQRLIGRSPSVVTPLEKSASGFRVSSTLRVNRSPFAWILENGETPLALNLLTSDPLHGEEQWVPQQSRRTFSASCQRKSTVGRIDREHAAIPARELDFRSPFQYYETEGGTDLAEHRRCAVSFESPFCPWWR